MDKPMATDLILIRHGNTIRVNGDYVHAPLTELGQDQATLTAQYLFERMQPLNGFYTSPLRRARETAALICDKFSAIPQVKSGVGEVGRPEMPFPAVCAALSI